MAEEELRPFDLRMLAVCSPIFQSYEITDDFENTTEYGLVYTELTGTITLWIEEILPYNFSTIYKTQEPFNFLNGFFYYNGQ